MQVLTSGAAGQEDLGQRALVALAKQRDSAAWSTLFSQHYDAVYRYIYGRLGQKEEAEDLASQVFLEALQSIASFNDTGKPLAAWFFGIARNLANNSVRRNKRLGSQESLDSEDNEAALRSLPGGLSNDSLDLMAGLDELTKEQRETIVLHFFVGLSAKETGHVLGKSQLAVYGLQVRGQAALRRRLGHGTQQREQPAA